MKKTLFILLFLSILTPYLSFATVSKHCDLEIEFSYENPNSYEKDLSGFRLYKEGKKICQVDNPNVRSFNCQFQSEIGGYHFTLAPYFSDGSEGSRSAAYPEVVGRAEITVGKIANFLLSSKK